MTQNLNEQSRLVDGSVSGELAEVEEKTENQEWEKLDSYMGGSKN